MDRLAEDDLFGAYVTELGGDRLVSRDLLDSIAEIYFLLDTVGTARLAGARVLDIGAGYGRLAHRLATAVAEISAVYCVDAIPEATFVSEYYLRFRGVGTKVAVVPLDEIETRLEQERIDVAVNIHSFSECTAAAVEWWIRLLVKHDVKWLMIAPNPGRNREARLLTTESDGSHPDFQGIIESAGYRLVERRPKYPDPAVQKYGPFPTFHHLFELEG
jgi:putative sugar O-methyltransferase